MFNGYRVFVWNDEKFLEIVVMVILHGECIVSNDTETYHLKMVNILLCRFYYKKKKKKLKSFLYQGLTVEIF